MIKISVAETKFAQFTSFGTQSGITAPSGPFFFTNDAFWPSTLFAHCSAT